MLSFVVWVVFNIILHSSFFILHYFVPVIVLALQLVLRRFAEPVPVIDSFRLRSACRGSPSVSKSITSASKSITSIAKSIAFAKKCFFDRLFVLIR